MNTLHYNKASDTYTAQVLSPLIYKDSRWVARVTGKLATYILYLQFFYILTSKDDGTPQILLRSTVRLFCNGTGIVRWYAV